MRKIYSFKCTKKAENPTDIMSVENNVVSQINASFPYTGGYYSCLAPSKSMGFDGRQTSNDGDIESMPPPTAQAVSLAREYRLSSSIADPLGMWTGNPVGVVGEKPTQDADDL